MILVIEVTTSYGVLGIYGGKIIELTMDDTVIVTDTKNNFGFGRFTLRFPTLSDVYQEKKIYLLKKIMYLSKYMV